MLHSEISGHVLGEGCGWWGGVRVGTAARLHNEDNLTLKLCYTSGILVHVLGEGRRVGWRGWGVGTAAMLHNEDNLALELCYTQSLWDTYWKRSAGAVVRS